MDLKRLKAMIRSFKRERGMMADLLILIVLWVSAAVLVNPSGNFPLNDDWTMGTTVKRLLDEGLFRPTGFEGMTLFSHVVWGALFCLPFGFSFTALRFSTLTMGLLGVIGVYLLIRLLTKNRTAPLAAALTLAFNPIYFALSFTFMTDVTFTAFVVWASYFLVRSLILESDKSLFAGACLTGAAVLCRQIGLFLPAVFALIVVVRHGLSLRWIFRACLPGLVGLVGLAGLQICLRASGSLPALHGSPQMLYLREFVKDPLTLFWPALHGSPQMLYLRELVQDPLTLFWRFKNNAFVSLIYLGLFLGPFMLLVSQAGGKKKKWAVWAERAVFFLFVGLSAVSFLLKGKFMPLTGFVLDKGGIGPLSLKDTLILELPHFPALPQGFWMLITVVGITGGGLLLVRLASVLGKALSDRRPLKESGAKLVTIFFLGGVALYFLPIFMVYLIDRYVIPVIPLLCAVMIVLIGQPNLKPRKIVTGASLILLLLFGMYSVAGTRDYLTWNRTRWNALNDLVEKERIPPDRIDGGYEFNGWHLYDSWHSFYKKHQINPGDPNHSSRSWWWVYDDAYMLAFGEMDGYDVIKKYGFSRWMPPGRDNIFVLHRRGDPETKDAHGKQAGE